MSGRLLRLTAVIALAVGCASVGLAQENQDQESQNLDTGRITTTDARHIVFDDGILNSQTVSFHPEDGPDQQTLALDDVLRVEVQSGNNGATYALVGGLSGLLGGLIGANTSSSDVEVSSSTKTTVIAVCTGLCAVVGYFVGAAQKKYETVYENPILGGLQVQPHETLHLPGDAVSYQVCLRF